MDCLLLIEILKTVGNLGIYDSALRAGVNATVNFTVLIGAPQGDTARQEKDRRNGIAHS